MADTAALVARRAQVLDTLASAAAVELLVVGGVADVDIVGPAATRFVGNLLAFGALAALTVVLAERGFVEAKSLACDDESADDDVASPAMSAAGGGGGGGVAAAPLACAPAGAKGRGVFARAPVASGSLIGRYEGRRLSAEEMAAKYDQRVAPADYVWKVHANLFLDASDRADGNYLRYVNHADLGDPLINVEPRVVMPLGAVYYFAARDIAPGEELLVNYGERYWQGREHQKEGVSGVGVEGFGGAALDSAAPRLWEVARPSPAHLEGR